MPTVTALLDPAFPHGRVEGYRQGCRGSICSKPQVKMSCEEVFTLYSGHYQFQKRYDQGMEPDEIMAQLKAEEKERSQEKQTQALPRGKGSGNSRPNYQWGAKSPDSPRVIEANRKRALVLEYYDGNRNDVEIAELTGIHPGAIKSIRRTLGLKGIEHRNNDVQHGTASGYKKFKCKSDDCPTTTGITCRRAASIDSNLARNRRRARQKQEQMQQTQDELVGASS